MKFKKKLTGTVTALATLLAASAQAEVSQDEITIGYLTDMTGMFADFAGPGGLEALEMAVDDFGGKVNGSPIRILSADDRNSADVGTSVIREWLDVENVDLMVGFGVSSVAVAATKLAEEYDSFAIITGSAASSLTNEYCTPNHLHWTYDSYPMANGVAKAILDQGDDTWFLLTADYAFGHAMEADVTRIVEENGGQVLGRVRHPLPTADFSSYILQAQGSGAKVIGLANAGADMVNAINTAKQFGIQESGQQLAGLLVWLTDVYAMGLESTQGLKLITGWYWNMDDEAREWANRYYNRVGRMPSMSQAGVYSSVTHYLNAVKATGSDDPATVRAHMMEQEINDFFARNGRIREDGRMVHDMYLAEVNSPSESEHEWDLYEIISTIPAEEAFRPLSQSKCDLVQKN